MADSFDPATAPAVNGNSIYDTTKNSMYTRQSDAAAAYNSVTNGPVADNVKKHTAQASTEFSNLAASRRTPSTPAATGQPLTHYHSFFSELLSWKNPRASAIAYASIITAIFATHYLDLIRQGLKLSWMVLGVTIVAELAGKLVMSTGLATQVRPRRYYTVPRETLDSIIGDVHELVNFFVIEAQRIVFAENIAVSATACVSSFLTYFLAKLVPYWGLSIIATTFLFFVPLVYTTNKELIDAHLKNASDIINSQTAQVKDVAQHQIDNVSAIGKQYAGEYTGKVQDMLRGRSTSPRAVSKPAPKHPEFPTAPTEEPIVSHGDSLLDSTVVPTHDPAAPMERVVPEEKPMIAS